MILVVMYSRPECRNHVYYTETVKDAKHVHLTQANILRQVPTNQHDQITMAICASTDDIKRHHDYQSVESVKEFVNQLDNPKQFNDLVDHKVRHNVHLQKIRHR